ncbi:cytochrome P450 4ae1 isoform X3 [Drosophila biarmipes]|uniref:cytochrome P450 4ae1 isoform X3 n=1 Tax=Drosophila biarmipes TaxID=125945 RepID=UPI0021CD16FB|nr:cytochrome P450 4ae1 isoform X3 [Drosophila biarmipes]
MRLADAQFPARHPDLHEKFAEYVRRFGSSFMGFVLGHVIVVTAEPRHVDALLHSQQQLRKGTMYLALRGWLGNGLLLSRGEEWHTMRKIITPAFHFSILEQFIEVFDRQSSRLVDRLEPLSHGSSAVNIYPYVGLAALDIITETAMGVSVGAQGDVDSEVVHAVKDLTNVLATRFMRPHLLFPQLFRLCWPSGFRKQQAGVNCLHQFTNGIIEQRRLLLARQAHQVEPEKRHALLDTLLRATVDGQTLTDKQIRDEVNTFIFEGHDTTTSAVSFCLYLLSRHEAVQKRLFEELNEHYGQNLSRGVVYLDFAELPYLNCVVKESLRLYPPIPAVARCLEKDLAVDGGYVPAGTNVVVLLWQLLRDETLFANPLLFHPERHLGAEASRLGPYSYIPFSAGPRNCIGQKFALLEMKTMVIKMVRHYQLLPMGVDAQPSIKIVLRSKTGVNFGLRPRSY